MSQTLAVDMDYITENIRKNWNALNHQQRSVWCMWNDLPICPYQLFDELPEAVQDALVVEYLDNAKRPLE